MQKILHMLLTSAALIASPSLSFALDVPNSSTDDTRIRYVSYNQWDVVRVVGTIRTAVQVIFDQTEEILDVAMGDTVAWEQSVRGNILYLKPREAHPPTNLQVATQRADGTTRTYSLELNTREGTIKVSIKGTPSILV